MSDRPHRVSGITEYEVEDELVLYDPRNDHAHVLNATAAVVWWMCDGEHSVDQIVAELADLYDTESSRIAGDVSTVLKDLASSGLITLPSTPQS